MIDKDDVTGVILAGGRGSRMGGADKGLQTFRGMPMAMYTLLRLAPQVGQVMINANRVKEVKRLFYGGYSVLLENGKQLTLSRRHRDKLQQLGL